MNTHGVKDVVPEQYGQAALRAKSGAGKACCGGSATLEACCDPPLDSARTYLGGQGIDVDAIAPQVDGKFMSSLIRAVKPAACCAPGCCA